MPPPPPGPRPAMMGRLNSMLASLQASMLQTSQQPTVKYIKPKEEEAISEEAALMMVLFPAPLGPESTKMAPFCIISYPLI